MSAFSDRRTVARAGVALLVANIRFWPSVAPAVGREIERWERRARAIEDPLFEAVAIENLREERFNAEVAATLATLAPRKHRQATVEAMVAYEILYDYLDGLTERPSADPLRDGRELYQALTDAIDLSVEPTGDYYASRSTDDGGYLDELVDVVRKALAGLPAASAITHTARLATVRCAEAQTRAHAVPWLGTTQLEQWARSEAAGTSLGWREFLTGAASSVLTVHALLAAAADRRTTSEQAAAIDTVYLSVGVLSTMLDSLVDYHDDVQADRLGYIRYYRDHDLLAQDLAGAARRAVEHSRALRDGAHHVMTLVGVAAYYMSAPTADSEFARPVTLRIHRELRPLITPTLAVMRIWRLVKRVRHPPPR